jgi:hypothetical protein
MTLNYRYSDVTYVSGRSLPGQGHAKSASLQSLAPAILGGVAELGLPAFVGHVTPTLIGLGASGARLGCGAAKYLFERQRYKSDLARRLAEARRLTTPFSKQPDLVVHAFATGIAGHGQ